MESFDAFVFELLEESKSFFETAKRTNDEFSKKAFLNASMLLSISAIEAGINSIIADILIEPYIDHYPTHDQGLLLEKDVKLENGKFVLSNSLKISRLTDRIEYLYSKFSKKPLKQDSEFMKWYTLLKQSIDYRNKLVHPKEGIELTENQIENTLLSVLVVLNKLFLVIYKKKIPVYDLGLNTTESISIN